MGKLRGVIAISLDGFVAGPNPTEQDPLGEGGEQLHEWALENAAWRRSHGREGGVVNASSEVFEQRLVGVGATIMGRGMFGGGPGPWGDEPWQGWWGDDPPFHVPVFVLTHHPRAPLELSDTTFHFVADGADAALAQARAAAGDGDVNVVGGGSAIRQYVATGALDELELDVVSVLLGSGTRLFDDGAGRDLGLEQIGAVAGDGVTHLRYRIAR